MSNSHAARNDLRSRVFAKRFRTEMCRGFMTTGACPYRAKCVFAHGEAELRTEQQNLDDGLVCESAIRAWKLQWKKSHPRTPEDVREDNKPIAPQHPTTELSVALPVSAPASPTRPVKSYRHNPYDTHASIVFYG